MLVMFSLITPPNVFHSLGGVTSMDSFLEKFFPSVYRKQKAVDSTNQYCKFDSQTLTMFTSSLYVAALFSSLVAAWVTRRLGRRLSMLAGAVLFCAGALVNGLAQNIAMLIVGRILLGFGIGFGNQVTLYMCLYGSENKLLTLYDIYICYLYVLEPC